MTTPDAEHRKALRDLMNVRGVVLYLLCGYLGLTMLLGSSDRFYSRVWAYVMAVPHPTLVWGIPPLIVCAVGLLGTVKKWWWACVGACTIGSIWAFMVATYQVQAGFSDSHANLWWPGLMYFLSAKFTLQGLSHTEKFL